LLQRLDTAEVAGFVPGIFKLELLEDSLRVQVSELVHDTFMHKDVIEKVLGLPAVEEGTPDALLDSSLHQLVVFPTPGIDVRSVEATQVQIEINEVVLAELMVHVEGTLIAAGERQVVNSPGLIQLFHLHGIQEELLNQPRGYFRGGLLEVLGEDRRKRAILE